ncbi:MAG: hypothetical protein ACI9RU_002663 [Litorivivens sp.]
MIKNRHSKITSILGALTLLVMLAGQILPYSETCFDIEIAEVVDFEDSEKDLDSDDEKEKIKSQELILRSEMTLASAFDFLFQQGFHSSPLLDIQIPPPEQA